MAAQSRAKPFDFCAELLQKVGRRAVEDRVHRIQSQSVEVIIPQPHQRVIDEKPSYFVAERTVKIQGLAPRYRVTVCEIRPELFEIVAMRAYVVVDHVQQNGERSLMAGVYESFKTLRPAISMMRSVNIYTVVAPVTVADKFPNRH